jgi:hypothetical protein
VDHGIEIFGFLVGALVEFGSGGSELRYPQRTKEIYNFKSYNFENDSARNRCVIILLYISFEASNEEIDIRGKKTSYEIERNISVTIM